MTEGEFIDAAEALPGRYATRLPGNDVAAIGDHCDGGEWDELLDDLLASLAANRATITSDEHAELSSLLDYAHMSADRLCIITVNDDRP